MENGKWKTENSGRESKREQFSDFRFSVEKICPACGTAATRDFAKFCRVCGKLLREEYQPLDNLRSSYHLQQEKTNFAPPPKVEIKNLFEQNENRAAELAWAFLVYSMVPYLGVLFCPGAILMSGAAVVKARRSHYANGYKNLVYSIAASILILAVQLLFWWLLYNIPEFGRR